VEEHDGPPGGNGVRSRTVSEHPDLATVYTKRRRALMEQMNEGIALIESSGPAPDPLLHDKNLRYLVGPVARDAVLLLAPRGIVIDRFETQIGPEVGRGRRVREVLFIPGLTARQKKIDGEGSPNEEVRVRTGVEAVKPLDELETILAGALLREEVAWINVAGPVPFSETPPRPLLLVRKVQERCPWIRFRNAAPLIHELRRVKDDHEIGCLRRAFEIHARIFSRLMASLKPGTNESFGKAIFDYEVGLLAHEGVSGAWNDLYTANIIVAAGKNSAIAHYMANDQPVADGDLVLIDGGVEVQGYASDITRTFPANGRFTARQRELYQITLDAQNEALATMKPGSTARAAHEAVYETFKAHGLDNYSYGTCGHPVGLNIHDANGWSADDDRPFEPGVVLVIEPFISIPEENVAIRIEDGVLITECGHEVLPGPPRNVNDVEALCAGA